MKVLVGIDGRENSLAALERAVERALEAGDDLTIGIVEDPDVKRSPEEVERRVRDVLSTVGVEAPVRHLGGHPGSSLVETAEDGEYDRLVLCGGERTPMGKVTLGNTTEFVLLNARTTVTLIR